MMGPCGSRKIQRNYLIQSQTAEYWYCANFDELLLAYHELPPGVWHVLPRGGRKHAHQLLQWFEWPRPRLKLVLEVANVEEVRGEGGVVVGEVPLPGAAAL